MPKGKPLTEDQLAMILQACTDFARQMIEEQGGFYPFGARVLPDGAIDFFQPVPETDPVDVKALYQETQSKLVRLAWAGEILGAAVVANADLPEGEVEGGFRDAIKVYLDAPGFCRMVYQPYRLVLDDLPGKLGAVETGKMFAVEAQQAIFAG